jgi:hypothetical protein
MAIRQGKTLVAFRRCVLATFLIAAPAARSMQKSEEHL